MIDDRYLMMVERIERSFLLQWQAPQPFDQFADQNITISLADGENIEVNLPDNLWLEATTQNQGERTVFVVYNAIFSRDATRIASEGISGKATELKLTLVDKADLSDLIATDFQIKYKTTRSDPRLRPVSTYSTKFDGDMPTELVERQGNRFTLDIGQLPIDPKYFRSDLGIEIEVSANRNFAGYSKTQRLIIKDVIGPFR